MENVENRNGTTFCPRTWFRHWKIAKTVYLVLGIITVAISVLSFIRNITAGQRFVSCLPLFIFGTIGFWAIQRSGEIKHWRKYSDRIKDRLLLAVCWFVSYFIIMILLFAVVRSVYSFSYIIVVIFNVILNVVIFSLSLFAAFQGGVAAIVAMMIGHYSYSVIYLMEYETLAILLIESLVSIGVYASIPYFFGHKDRKHLALSLIFSSVVCALFSSDILAFIVAPETGFDLKWVLYDIPYNAIVRLLTSAVFWGLCHRAEKRHGKIMAEMEETGHTAHEDHL